MFNSTHTLVGVAIARVGPAKWVRYATVTSVIASNLPDIDIVSGFAGTPAYIDHHRGFTHSLIGVPIVALLLAAAIYLFSGNFWKTYTIALIAMATHPLLDYANSYGLRPFLPFDGTWHYGDVLFIIDPYMDLLLLSGIVAGSARPDVKRMLACLSLAAIGFYAGVRAELHHMAALKLHAALMRTPAVEKWAVLPQMLSPFRWQGIIQTNQEVARVDVDAFRGLIQDSQTAVRMPRHGLTQITERAAQARSAATLLRFARFPVERVQPLSTGYRVLFVDFSFYNKLTNTSLASEVVLDKSLNVVQESLSFNHRLD